MPRLKLFYLSRLRVFIPCWFPPDSTFVGDSSAAINHFIRDRGLVHTAPHLATLTVSNRSLYTCGNDPTHRETLPGVILPHSTSVYDPWCSLGHHLVSDDHTGQDPAARLFRPGCRPSPRPRERGPHRARTRRTPETATRTKSASTSHCRTARSQPRGSRSCTQGTTSTPHRRPS